MNNKFENENEEEKLCKKGLLVRTLHRKTGPNLSFSLCIKSLVFIFIFKNYLKLS